jgi:hypothetical protein
MGVVKDIPARTMASVLAKAGVALYVAESAGYDASDVGRVAIDTLCEIRLIVKAQGSLAPDPVPAATPANFLP